MNTNVNVRICLDHALSGLHLCRVTYGSDGVGRVSKQLYSALTSLQMGLATDNMNWTVELK